MTQTLKDFKTKRSAVYEDEATMFGIQTMSDLTILKQLISVQ